MKGSREGKSPIQGNTPGQWKLHGAFMSMSIHAYLWEEDLWFSFFFKVVPHFQMM